MKFIFSSILLLFLAPCNKPKTITDTKQETDYSKISITYRQTACYGKCPVTSMTINGGTKTATYIGQMNTERLGKYTKVIKEEDLKSLVAAFEKANFFSFNEKYLGMTSDFPSIVIEYSKDGKTKTVTDRQAGPKQLIELELLLKEIQNGNDWKKEEPVGN